MAEVLARTSAIEERGTPRGGFNTALRSRRHGRMVESGLSGLSPSHVEVLCLPHRRPT